MGAGQYQASFTGGVVDDTLVERTDVDVYQRGLASGRNLEILPQGGARNADGTVLLGRIRGTFETITPASNTIAGGAATGDRTLGTMTFSGVVALVAFDLTDVKVTPATGTFVVETSSDGVTWTAFGSAFVVESTKTRTRRFAMPPGQARSCDRLRVRVVDPSVVATTITIGSTTARSERDDLPPARVRPFTSSRDAVYDLVYTPANIDVWGYDANGADVWLAAIASPLAGSHIEAQAADGTYETFSFAQSLDTELLFHKDVAPYQILRLGNGADWDGRSAVFTNIPNHDYGATYSNTVEIWEIEFVNTLANNMFVITIAGEDTLSFTAPATYDATWEATLKAKLETAPNVKPGLTVTYLAGARYRVQFTGDGNEGPWATMTGKVLNSATAAISCARAQRGEAGGEAIISTTRGWPRCGAFWQQRLVMGGLRSLPSTMLLSVTGEFFNFDTRRAQADNAIVLPMDVDADEVIHRIFPGRHLQVFTSSGEYWFSDRAIDATQPQTIVLGTRNGIAGHVPVAENEGGTLYVHNNRSVLLEYAYTNEEQNYGSLNISLLSSSIIKDVRDAALQKANVASDANRLLLVDGLGRLIVYSILRAQSITAPVPRETDGRFVSVAVNGRNDVTVLVRRTVGNRERIYVERVRKSALLDQSVTVTPTGTAIAGLTEHEGATVWAIADNAVYGPFVVAGGAIELPYAAPSATVGRWTAPEGETLDLPKEVGPRVVLERPRRVHTVTVSLKDATSFALGANGGRLFSVPLHGHDQATDTPELLNGFTGERTLTGLQGWTPNGRVRFGQLRPGRFILRSLTSEGN